MNGRSPRIRNVGSFIRTAPIMKVPPMSASASAPESSELASRLLAELTAIVGAENVLHHRDELLVYECDGYVISKKVPDVVVFPTCTEHVVELVKLCNRHDVPFVPRGAGTSLAGGTMAVGGGVMICLTRMKRILEINTRDRYAIVEPGVVNVWLTRTIAGQGFHYAPDPSSQTACTIGGNVATNSGGPHTLKYGVTVNHIRGVELVLPDATVVQIGGITEDNPGYDLTGLVVGSEGTFGIVTKVIVNLTRDPESGRTLLGVFDSVEAATETVSGIIAAGIVPAALEMLDNLMIQAVEQAFGFGFPTDAGAILIIEIDGIDAGQDREAQAISEIVRVEGGHGPEVDHLADPQGAGIRGHLEEPQVGLRRHRPAQPHVLHAGRRGAADVIAPYSALHRGRFASAMISGSPTSSTPETATSIRSFSSTSKTRTRSRGYCMLATRSSRSASGWEAA